MGHGEPQNIELEPTLPLEFPVFDPETTLASSTGPLVHAGRRAFAEGPDVFMHIVMFRMYEGTTDETIKQALEMMRQMCEAFDGILAYQVALSLDTRKGQVLTELIQFPDQATFVEFRDSPAHLAFGDFIRQHAHWNIGDYTVDTNLL